jgi:hypothetical protein
LHAGTGNPRISNRLASHPPNQQGGTVGWTRFIGGGVGLAASTRGRPLARRPQRSVPPTRRGRNHAVLTAGAGAPRTTCSTRRRGGLRGSRASSFGMVVTLYLRISHPRSSAGKPARVGRPTRPPNPPGASERNTSWESS